MVRHEVGRGPYLCRRSGHLDDDVQISALDAFYEMDGRKSRFIGDVLEWSRREDAGDLKRSELDELVENLTCLNAFEGKIWKSDQKVLTCEKINPKILMHEKIHSKIAMDEELVQNNVMDEDLVQSGVMDVKNFVLTNAQFETVSIVPNTYHHPQRETSTPSYTGTVSLAGIWITSSKSSRIPWRSSESGGSDPVAQAQERCSSVCGLIEKLINMPNLSGGKGALTPGGKDIWRDVRDSDGELEYSEAKLVQAAAGLEQYIALDRPGIAYSVKTLQQMSKPTKLMQLRVVRVGCYLKNNPRLVWKFPYQQGPRLELRSTTGERRSSLHPVRRACEH